MSDYALYRSSKNITNNDIVAVVRKDYPGYSKIQNSMIMNPDRYGIKLTEDAETALVCTYGVGPGLDVRPASRKSTPIRKKPNRLVVYLGDELNNRVRDLIANLGYRTTQEFLEDILSSMVEQSMGGAAE